MYQPLPSYRPHQLLHPTSTKASRLNDRQGEGRQTFGANPLFNSVRWTAVFRDGLPTPPTDMTGISLHNPHSTNYGAPGYNYSSHAFPVGSNMANPNGVQYSHQGTERNQLSVHSSDSRKEDISDSKRSSGNSIATYLQIPSSINDSKGSLAEFAAQITCLFWFESSANLQQVEDSSTTLRPIHPLVPEAFPSMGFRKWVTTILTTTQVTQNVILLALLFIYRLKKFNPQVSGKKGSEFRLLTIALMLGNKFLDDNTYTNKTWAEVSGISVQEIHIMEVEFLSNMRYNLFVSENEWKAWHIKLGKFWLYFDNASKAPPVDTTRTTVGPAMPSLYIPPYMIPSPLVQSPTYTGSLPGPHVFPQHPLSLPPHLPLSPVRQVPSLNTMITSRKRSYDEQSWEPPAKRITRSKTPSMASSATATPPSRPVFTPATSSTSSSTNVTPLNIPRITPQIPRLPMPNPNIRPTTNPLGNDVFPPSNQLPFPAGRAMATVYDGSASWSEPQASSTALAPAPLSVYSNPNAPTGDHSRHQSPFPVPSAVSAVSSPNSAALHPSHNHSSPSYFLTNRNSPYRPVRAVNTLLIPPPSASMHNQHRNLTLDQMHYQPLGKSITERKQGVVPYLHRDAWPQNHTPQSMLVPQPNFVN